MSFTAKNKDRVINYLTGLLAYYGAIKSKDLLRFINEHLKLTLQQQDLDNIVTEAESESKSSLLFNRRRDLFYSLEVDDLKGLLNDQASRKNIAFRPVTEKEALAACSLSAILNRSESAKKLTSFLGKNKWSEATITTRLHLGVTLTNNNNPPIKVIEHFLSDLAFDDRDDIDVFVSLFARFINSSPQWALKGWAPEEIIKEQENPHLAPHPDEQFAQESLFSGAGKKVGRNEPCPCGSGKKFKKCCGSGASTEISLVPPPSTKKIRKDTGELGVNRDAGIRTNPKISPQIEEPTVEEWQALFFAAEIFKAAKCWDWMYEGDIFGVKNPESGEIAYVSIMGNGDQVYSLSAYLGTEGLESFYDLQDAEDEGQVFEAYYRLKAVVASFEDRSNLSKEDLALIKSLDLQFRGKKQWPQFRIHEPGLYPWKIDSAQCRFLTIILEQAFAVSLLCKKSKAILDGQEPEQYLVCTLKKVGGQEHWVNDYLERDDIAIKFHAYTLEDSLYLRNLLKQVKRTDDVWEADTFYIAAPIKENKGDRPYLPTLFMVASQNKEMILTFKMLTDLESEAEFMLDCLLDLIESGEKLPARLLVEKNETYLYLEEICKQLKLKLQKVDRLKVMPEIRADMNRHSPIY
jgi:hypothetical protein